MHNQKYPYGHNTDYGNTPKQKKSPAVLILILSIVLVVLVFAGIFGVIYLTGTPEPAAVQPAIEEPVIAPEPQIVTVRYVDQWPIGVPTESDIYKAYSEIPETGVAASTKEHVGYIYWHWCRGEYKDGPINRTTRLVMGDRHDTFHAYFSTERPDISGDMIYDGSRWVVNPTPDGTYHHPYSNCTDTYWFYVIDVWEQTFMIEE